MAQLPTGTVTFLFTDIEESAALWDRHPGAMREALARHDAIVKGAIQKHSGYVFATGGDSFSAAFERPMQAIDAAIEAQRVLAEADWGVLGALRTGMAIHTGIADERDGDYFGPPVNRTARILSVAEGGDVLISQTTLDLLRHHLQAAGFTTTDLGRRRLKGIGVPEQIHVLDLGPRPRHRPTKRRAVVVGLLALGPLVALAVVVLPSALTPESSTAETTIPESTTMPVDEPAVIPAGSMRWEQSLEAPASGVAIEGDVVYTTTTDGMLQAFDINSGDELWRFDTSVPIDHPPVVAGGTVYVTTRAGYQLLGLSLSGEVTLRCSFGFLEPGPPTIVDRMILLGAGASGFFYTVDTSAGSECDPLPVEYALTGLQQITTPPVVADRSVYLGDVRGDVVALEFDNPNEKRWPGRYFTGTGSVVGKYDGRVESLAALEVTRVGATGQRTEVTLVVSDAEGFLHLLDGETGRLRSDPVTIAGTPTIVENLVYYLAPGWLVVLDADLNEERVELPAGDPAIGPTINGELLSYATDDGTVISLHIGSWMPLMREPGESPAAFLTGSGRVVAVVDEAGVLKVVDVPSPPS